MMDIQNVFFGGGGGAHGVHYRRWCGGVWLTQLSWPEDGRLTAETCRQV
jgi:hypothetical protein